jgi:uncharacterized protein YndB with AHSA1/START domain
MIGETVAPIRVSVTVRRPPAEVFRTFTQAMDTWWPLATHSMAADTYEGRLRAVAIVFEERTGGRIYERMSDGREGDWGRVLVWDPPARVVFSWKPNLTAAPPTEVEVRFVAEGSGTRVELEHRGWERLGEAGQNLRRGYESGWPGVLARFGAALDARERAATASGMPAWPRKQPWFERRFPTGLSADVLPIVIERLRGTPVRLVDRLSALSAAILTRRLGESWSIQENAGHLLDLEPLWLQRLDDLLARRAELTVADLTNRKTHEANHNAVPLLTLLERFRRARPGLVARLEVLVVDDLTVTALHPRLRIPMGVVDHAFFIAEHDDYHLARITELLRTWEGTTS